jgi:hypothetical protein
MAVVIGQLLAQLAQVEAMINAAEEMILWDVVFKVEGIEEPFLAIGLKPHHIKALRSFDRCNIIIHSVEIGACFSTESGLNSRWP